MLGARGAKKHRGVHKADCPSRSEATPNGVTHRGECDDLPDTITEAPAPSEQGTRDMVDMFKAFQAFMGGGEAATPNVPAPSGPKRGRGGPRIVQPEAEKPPKAAKPETKTIALGDEDTQPNGAWWSPLGDGLTAYGFVVKLVKLNKNYGRNEFPDPSAIADGNQILHNNSPWQCHGESLGEAKEGQEYQTMSWPIEQNIYDVLSDLDGWDRNRLNDIE